MHRQTDIWGDVCAVGDTYRLVLILGHTHSVVSHGGGCLAERIDTRSPDHKLNDARNLSPFQRDLVGGNPAPSLPSTSPSNPLSLGKDAAKPNPP